MYKKIEQCRICGNSNLTEVLNLGEQYLSSSFVKSNEDNELAKIKIPLKVVLCDKKTNSLACGLVQLRETVERNLMYQNYFYRSAINPMMCAYLKDIVASILERIKLSPQDCVLDIGCNDGTMLTYFPSYIKRFGIDPAKNIDRSGLDKSIGILTDYFSQKNALAASGGKLFKIISSIAMFYDLDDPNSFVQEIKSVLAPGGIWCIQLSYLPTSLQTLNFYDVCHEHLEYYTLRVLDNLMQRHGLYVFDAALNEVNGGSLRVFITNKENIKSVSQSLKKILAEEDKMDLTEISIYNDFGRRINNLKKTTLDLIKKEVESGGLVVGLGASTKGNVLLQFFNIDKSLMPYISERNPEKIGLRTLGTDIELISEKKAMELRPSFMPVLIWFFKEELVKREKEYLARGGKLFFPMPYPHIVNKDGEQKIYTD